MKTMEPQSLWDLDFARAKTALSEIMTEVVHGHHPALIRRHHGKEVMLLVAPEDLEDLFDLDGYRFDPQVTMDDGEVTVALRDLGILGFGDSLEGAMADLVRELRLYTQRFFDRWIFYRETDRRKHAPLLFRFVLTPPEQQLELLYLDSRITSQHSDGPATAAR
jgi:hypothetical protein